MHYFGSVLVLLSPNREMIMCNFKEKSKKSGIVGAAQFIARIYFFMLRFNIIINWSVPTISSSIAKP